MIKKGIVLLLAIMALPLIGRAPEPLIRATTINDQTISYTINKEFKNKYLITDTFFVEYDESIDVRALDYSIATIPCVLTLIPIVWISNKTYTIEEMDEDLYHALISLKRIFQSFFPSSRWAGSLEPSRLVKHTAQHNIFDNATLFSGGLDAVYSALSLQSQKQLLITIWGGDVSLDNQNLWEQVKKQCQDFSTTYAQSHTWCKSNFRTIIDDGKLNRICSDIYYWWGYTSQAFNYLGLVAPIAYTHGISKIYIGSSHTIEFPYPYGSHPLIDNAIAYAGITTIHHGAELNRLQKINALKNMCTEQNLPTPFLRVCSDSNAQGKNCMACEKCLRTLLELWLTHTNSADFGLPETAHTLYFMREQVKSLQSNYFLTTAYHWNLLKAYIKDHVPQESYDARVKDLCLWIAEQPVKDPIKPYQKYRLQDLQTVWQKSLQGTFTLDDLAILPPALHNKKHSTN